MLYLRESRWTPTPERRDTTASDAIHLLVALDTIIGTLDRLDAKEELGLPIETADNLYATAATARRRLMAHLGEAEDVITQHLA